MDFNSEEMVSEVTLKKRVWSTVVLVFWAAEIEQDWMCRRCEACPSE